MSINLQTGTNRIHKHTYTYIDRINTVRTKRKRRKKQIEVFELLQIGNTKKIKTNIDIVHLDTRRKFSDKMFVNKIQKTSGIDFWSYCGYTISI